MSSTTSKTTPPSQSPDSDDLIEPDTGADLLFPVETDIIIDAAGNVTITDLPQELVELAFRLGNGGDKTDQYLAI